MICYIFHKILMMYGFAQFEAVFALVMRKKYTLLFCALYSIIEICLPGKK